jgi:hypothetical protein
MNKRGHDEASRVAAEAERERCAKIAEAYAANTSDGAGEIYIARKIADAIRLKSG